MIKGLSQSKRNNAWHIKHTDKKAAAKRSHLFRVLNRKNGIKDMSIAEKQYQAARERESNKHVSFWQKLKYMWFMAKIKTKAQIKRLFPNQMSHA